VLSIQFCAASWPGDAKLERSLEWIKEQSENQKTPHNLEANERDPDTHPVAALDRKNFEGASQKFDTDWFLGNAEERMVLESRTEFKKHEYDLRSKKRRLVM